MNTTARTIQNLPSLYRLHSSANDLVTSATGREETAHAIARPALAAPGHIIQPLPAVPAGPYTLSARTGTAHSGTAVRPKPVIPLSGDDDDEDNMDFKNF